MPEVKPDSTVFVGAGGRPGLGELWDVDMAEANLGAPKAGHRHLAASKFGVYSPGPYWLLLSHH